MAKYKRFTRKKYTAADVCNFCNFDNSTCPLPDYRGDCLSRILYEKLAAYENLGTVEELKVQIAYLNIIKHKNVVWD